MLTKYIEASLLVVSALNYHVTRESLYIFIEIIPQNIKIAINT